jgi:hypothetical protein
LFDSGILLIIDLNKKKGKKGGGVEFYLWILQLNKCCFDSLKRKIKKLLRLKLKSALKIEQISVVL